MQKVLHRMVVRFEVVTLFMFFLYFLNSTTTFYF